MTQDDWMDEEDEAFDSPLTQRTEELYRIPNHTPNDKKYHRSSGVANARCNCLSAHGFASICG